VHDVAVVNASPLISLAKIGALDVLASSAPSVLVPAAVVAEVLAGPPGDPARQALERGWGLRVPDPEPPAAVLEWSLGRGETSVLAVALATPSLTAVLDDAEARACARALGVPCIGTLGLVLRAAVEGRLQGALATLRALKGVGVRLDSAALREALAQTTGETWED
jgi:predicted nucleic acid-binding protein